MNFVNKRLLRHFALQASGLAAVKPEQAVIGFGHVGPDFW